MHSAICVYLLIAQIIVYRVQSTAAPTSSPTYLVIDGFNVYDGDIIYLEYRINSSAPWQRFKYDSTQNMITTDNTDISTATEWEYRWDELEGYGMTFRSITASGDQRIRMTAGLTLRIQGYSSWETDIHSWHWYGNTLINVGRQKCMIQINGELFEGTDCATTTAEVRIVPKTPNTPKPTTTSPTISPTNIPTLSPTDLVIDGFNVYDGDIVYLQFRINSSAEWQRLKHNDSLIATDDTDTSIETEFEYRWDELEGYGMTFRSVAVSGDERLRMTAGLMLRIQGYSSWETDINSWVWYGNTLINVGRQKCMIQINGEHIFEGTDCATITAEVRIVPKTPNTPQPTTNIPTTSNPTTKGPTTITPTTSNPTTSNPTTANPTTYDPTIAVSTTEEATTSNPSTYIPTTSKPTDDPTDVPTVKQTSKPSVSPTVEREGAVNPTSEKLNNYYNDSDLKISVNTSNGTFNQYHVIRRVNESLKAVLDDKYTLNVDIIKPNISINFLVDIDDDNEEEINEQQTAEELKQKIKEDLGKDSDIIYDVKVTETDEVTIKYMSHPFEFNNFDELIVAISSFLGLIVLISYIDAKWIRINDYHCIGTLFIAILQIMDMIYDCLLCIKIRFDSDFNDDSITSPLFVLFILCITFIVIPTIITLIQLHFEMTKWKHIDELSQYLLVNTALLYIISAICGSSFIAVRVCCSNLLNLSYFDMPLNQIQKSSFYTKRVYSTVLLENLPQIVIQILYLSISSSANSETNYIVYISMAFSILSIIISILSMFTTKNILQSRDYVTIEFDVKGDVILSNLSQCKNRYKILQKHLSLIFGLNVHIIEIKKPLQIPNGLKVCIILHINNTKSIDINYEQLIKDANKSGKLASILKESWSLSTVPMTGNIKYKKYDSQYRKDHTVNIQSMSEQIVNYNINDIPINTNILQMTAIPIINTDDIQPGSVDIEGNNNNINNESLPPIIPPVVVTADYGISDGNNGDDIDDSQDIHTKLTNHDTEDQDAEIIQYINNVDNVDNVTLGNSMYMEK